MRAVMRVLGVVVALATVLILIPYIGLGPGGEAQGLQTGDWAAWVLGAVLIALLGFGTATLLLWGAARLARRSGGRPDGRRDDGPGAAS